MDTKRCIECDNIWPIVFFTRMGPARNDERRPVCKGCEQNKRDEKKLNEDGRWRVKIQDTIKRHATKLKFSIEELDRKYGWHLNQMIHDAQHAYANGCQYCHRNFLLMGHGIQDIWLDILNPEDEPYYITNVRWCCPTCNREKQRMPPQEFAALRQCWEEYERWRNSPAALGLFANVPPPPPPCITPDLPAEPTLIIKVHDVDLFDGTIIEKPKPRRR